MKNALGHIGMGALKLMAIDQNRALACLFRDVLRDLPHEGVGAFLVESGDVEAEGVKNPGRDVGGFDLRAVHADRGQVLVDARFQFGAVHSADSSQFADGTGG